MHQNYGQEGVACVSVSVDELDNQERTLDFLRKQNAAFPNYLLDEPTGKWQDIWKFTGPPAVFVYHRDGKLARKFDNDDPDNQFDYDDVEQFVRKLLRGE